MGCAIALLVLVVYPVTEIAVASWVAGQIGWGLTLGLLAAGLAVGILVMRSAGGAALRTLGDAARTGNLPDGQVGNHALTFLGGLLIAMPGFVTDVLGLLLIVPPTRSVIRRGAGRALGRRVRAAGLTVVSTTATNGTPVTRVVDGDVVRGEVLDRRDDPPRGNRPASANPVGDERPGVDDPGTADPGGPDPS